MSTASGLDIEAVDLTAIVGDHEIACENHSRDWCRKEAAQWAAHLMCPGCAKSRWELWCTPCRDFVTATEDGFECAQCGLLVFPGRHFIAQFEPLEKR